MKSILLKAILLSIAVIALFSTTIAQKGKTFSGVITYEISYPDMELDPSMAGQLPTSMTLTMLGDKTRQDMNMGMVSQTVILDKKANKMTLLMDVMGQKICYKEEIKKDEEDKTQVKILDETKDIAGYKCKKAEITDDEGNVSTIFFTDEFTDAETSYKGIKGALMEFENKQGNMKMRMVAKSVEKKKVKDTEFLIPSDYKEVTKEELQKMFGGGDD